MARNDEVQTAAARAVLVYQNRKGVLPTLQKRRMAEVHITQAVSLVTDASFNRARAHVRQALLRVYGPEPKSAAK